MNYDIIIISCGAKKRKISCQAQDMYIGPLFKSGLRWAKKQNKPIYIVSTKYGLLPLNKIISPYEMTLKNLSKFQINEWSRKIANSLPPNKNILCMTSKVYSLFSRYYQGRVITPLTGLGIGKRLKWFKENM